jgi:branched-chain amino acid transport system substrate-binding protein
MKRAPLVVAFAVIAGLAVAAAGLAKTDGPATTRAVLASASCKNPTIAVMYPLTGDVAFIGQEQLKWSQYAVSLYNSSKAGQAAGRRFRLLQGDSQLNPAVAATVGQRFASNAAVLGIAGPSGSQEVVATGGIFRRSGLVSVSPSATATDLSNGRFPTFFRVVPNDSKQAPTDARFMVNTLKAKDVHIVDDQTAYSVPFANAVQANLRARKVKVTRDSVSQQTADFSSIVSKIASSTKIVFLPWQEAASAQTFANQMREKGKRATVFGGDGLYSPTQFTAEGAYVSAFAPDIRGVRSSRALVSGYVKRYDNKFGTFGPPSFLAAQVLINAVNNACKNDGKATRREVLSWTKKTSITPSILGGTLRFTAKGDPLGAKFYIFKIVRGKYTLVG